MPILDPSHFDLIRPLFQPLEHHLATAAILAGSAPATIYVDDPAQPGAAFTWTGYRFFLAGSPGQAAFNEEVRTLLAETIAPQALASGLEMFELKVASEDWEAPIQEGVRLHDPYRPVRRSSWTLVVHI